ncbi:septation ring formation regulator EzrA [Lacticaseibacillus brantae]|uniref:Septation ring formation regulator EzrA n=1 Tax=Lacticaseibacillus brantae DSM 23927 TaxID=1423727 RepID=A0A0R2B056_9LACO|nr:septation ring formation regulator EzrA [Lacticaseibacillus brantae]KRM72904.1 septation ring formation negative regulator [Lacticaseibacillus brantae DSM 23927]
MIWIVIGLIVLLAIVGGYFWMRQRLVGQLTAAQDRYAALEAPDIDQTTQALTQLQLSGESLKAFTKLQREYQQFVEATLNQVAQSLVEAQAAISGNRFPSARAALATVNETLPEAETTRASFAARFQQLRVIEADNQKQLEKINEDFQSARKTILAKGFVFGDALPALENQLETVDSAITEVQTDSAAGDYLAAQNVLKDLTQDVGVLSAAVKELPTCVNELVNEFPAQVSELDRGYQTLVADHYQFGERNIPEELADIQGQIDGNLLLLKQVDVPAIKANNADIAEAIDGLYATMEQEMAAKQQIKQLQDSLRQFIGHAQQQSRKLLLDLDHLNQSYTLTHDELTQAQELANELSEIETGFNQDAEHLASQTAVFSQVHADFLVWQAQLKEIETKQVAINEQVASLRRGEEEANHQLDQFEQSLRELKRKVEAQQLPGLNRDYLDFYKLVSDEMQALDHDLNQVKINMDEINRNLIKIQADLDELAGKTQVEIDAAGMTEALLQYANRYKLSKPEVSAAVQTAQKAFANYQYQEAADTLGTVLEKVEPGSFQKVDEIYQSQKQESLF